MSNKVTKNKNKVDFKKDFLDLLHHIQQARQKVFAQVNTALIDLYWQIGKTISFKVQTHIH